MREPATRRKRREIGFTLLSTLIAVVLFGLMAYSAYSVAAASMRGMRTYREKAAVSALANQYMEIARNLSYSKIGTLNGNPSGLLADQPNALQIIFNKVTYKIYYEVTYVDDPADGTALAATDPAPNDYKQVKVIINNPITGLTIPFITNVTPKGLENLASGGALYLKVFDAVGQPIAGATLQITNSSTTPVINLTRTTDSAGNWIEVGLPNSSNSYHVVATKSGYSVDQTYPISVQNPSPTKPDATISNGQVTQISFSIDKQSSLNLTTADQYCQPISGVGIALQGSKLIGTPNVLKFSNTYTTNGSGQVSLNPLEWDTYTPGITTSSYMIYGSSPIQQIAILPSASQVATLILGPTTNHSLLVIVKDAGTENPLEGATVELKNTGLSYDVTKFTAGSILYQQDWSGGSGQSNFVSTNAYYADDANVDTLIVPTGLRLKKVAGNYSSSGDLTSSSFDTGTASSSYTTLTWNPTSQSASTSLSFQIATNNDNATWNFVGPDGTDATYFTAPGTSIHTSNNNARYLRYKAFLSTASSTITPVLSNVTVNYVSGCFTPGQIMFAGLQANNTYQVVVSLSGYQTQTISNINISGYNVLQVLLNL